MGFKSGHPPFASPQTESEHLTLGARHCDDARRNLIRAMHHLDEVGAGKVWQHLAVAVHALDDARSVLTERAPEVPSGRRHS